VTLPAPRPRKATALPGFSNCNFQFAICKILFLITLPAHALHFPDTSDLKREYRVSARKDGHPTDFSRRANGDSASLKLEWAAGNPVSVRLEQSGEFDPDSFSVLTSGYGNGAAWHESMSARDPKTLQLYPGLQQEWILKGYGGEKGWLGSGLVKGRYFLVFRENPPTAMATVTGPLRLNRGLPAFLDTSSQWLRIPCKTGGRGSEREGTSGGKSGRPKATGIGKTPEVPVCFSPGEDSRFLIRIERKAPLDLEAWFEDGESPALHDIRTALKSVPDAAQAEYAGDLSQMLLGEAQMFLVKLAQRLPSAFNWPSWQIQDFKAGRVPAGVFLPIVRRQAVPGDSLPAFRYQDQGLKLSVDLHFSGRFHLLAEAIGPAPKSP
jgi:hypothetical protein